MSDSDFSMSDTFFGVGRPNACAAGRSGELPCWRTISCIALPFSSIDTMAAWSNGRSCQWAYHRELSRSARVSPRVLPGISTYSSCAAVGAGAGEGAATMATGVGIGT